MGKSSEHNERGGFVLPAQPFMPARHAHCAWASVQWLTLSGAGAGLVWSHTVPIHSGGD